MVPLIDLSSSLLVRLSSLHQWPELACRAVLESPGGPRVQCKVVLHKASGKNNPGLLVLISSLSIYTRYI